MSVLVLVKSKMMQSHQYDDDGKQVEIFSVSTVSLCVCTHSTVASGGTATSAVCRNSLPASGQLKSLLVGARFARLRRNHKEMLIAAQVVRQSGPRAESGVPLSETGIARRAAAQATGSSNCLGTPAFHPQVHISLLPKALGSCYQSVMFSDHEIWTTHFRS